jgi:hypothetical protein
LRIPLKDTCTQLLDIDNHIKPAHEFIDRCKSEKQRVLVHCACGVSRSPAIVISYLLHRKELQFGTLVDAYAAVTARRPCVNVNIGFRKQLVALEWLYSGEHEEEPHVVNALCELCFPGFDRGVIASVVQRFWDVSLESCSKSYEIINQMESYLYCLYNGKKEE